MGNELTWHPLDPLEAAEVARTTALLDVPEDWLVVSIELVEPTKAELRAFEDGLGSPTRLVEVVCLDRAANLTHRARVDLTAGRRLSLDPVPDVQPLVTLQEWDEADAMLREHPDVVAALARRGVSDMALVLMDTWTYGRHAVPEAWAGRRVGWTDCWVRREAGANPYAGPVDGLHCVVDLNRMELLEISDRPSGPRPQGMGEYVPRLVPAALRDRRPVRRALEIVQPEGPSFTLDGRLLRWQQWSMRIGFNHREGMTLHSVRYTDPYAPGGPRERSVAHRLSFAEMVVPYRDPSPDHVHRTAFDIGEWGLGFLTTSLSLGCDCLGEIRYLDAVVHDAAGRPRTIENAICVHEEDAGVAWKHLDHAPPAEVRRGRRLVVSFHVTVANYDYLVYWRFYEDGAIECEVRATGILLVAAPPPDGPDGYGAMVDAGTYAPYHQHFVVARLDLDVDGETNTVHRSEAELVPMGADNPYGVALRQVSTPLRTEAEGQQDYTWETQRSWTVVNNQVHNAFGRPVGYRLVPGSTVPALFDPRSPVLRRAGVIGHTLWVTPHDPAQRWPAGEFPNQSGPGEGLPSWVQANRSIADTDVVLWYTFGIHHVTRPEDWPVMPVDIASFWLKPAGFFDRNPALDLPPSAADHCAPGHGR